MAKLRGAKKAAFLRRMARGRAKSRRSVGTVTRRRTSVRRRKAGGFSGYLKQSRKRPGVVRFRVRRNPLSALIANPGYSPAYAAGWESTFGRKKRRRKGAKSMAKKRRRSSKRSKRRASPRRRVYKKRRGASRRRRSSYRRGGGVARVRRGTRLIYINPRKGRRRGIRRRRNPGFGGGLGGLFKRALVPYAAGVITAGAAAMLDTGLASWPIVRQLVKVGGVFGIAAFFGRKHPNAAAAAIGAIGASQGYPLITQLAGGLVARTPAEAVKGLGAMATTYPEMGALLQGGLGALLQGPTDVEDVTSNYASALTNMADDDDDD